jgi:predicted TIM-barrel enzyme
MSARPADNAVILTGVQTGGAPDRRVFTHVYLRESSGAWKLLSSTTVAAAR